MEIELSPCGSPITTAKTKLGGQPVWLGPPVWPLDRRTREPMRFIGQFRLPGERVRLAYLFIADEDGSAETAEPFGGRNALVIQPDGRVPDWVDTTDAAHGPSLCTRGTTWDELVPVEIGVDLVPVEPARNAALDAHIDWDEAYRRGELMEPPETTDYPDGYVGGRPHYLQGHLPAPVDEQWDFFFRLDDGEGWDGEPYALNFGGGYGYAFLSADNNQGAFYWEC